MPGFELVTGGFDLVENRPQYDDFVEMPFIHLAWAGGYDHMRKPDYVIGTPLESKWDEVIKVGRYGEGLCARIDTEHYLRGTVTSNYFQIARHHPSFFYNSDIIVQWSANTLADRPNGYNCILPLLQRCHVYQKPGSAWMINTLFQFDDITDPSGVRLAFIDGELRQYQTNADIDAGIYTVLKKVSCMTNKWYSLEIRQDPVSPLEAPCSQEVVSDAGGDSIPVAINLRILINRTEIYSKQGFTIPTDNSNMIGYCKGVGNTNVFIDNYYAVFGTPEGLASFEDSTWVIRNDQPIADKCRGQWTAFDEVADTRSVSVDYSEYIKFTTQKSMIQHTANAIFEPDYPYKLIDGNYSKFNYQVPVPYGSTPVWTFTTTLERYNVTVPAAFRGAWIMLEDYQGWQRRNVSGSGTDNLLRAAASGDPYNVAGDILFATSQRQQVYYKYLPVAKSVGSINLGTDYIGATLP
ncbi:MAG: hypothetical protein ACK5LG_21930 [Bacteroides thetaiotaomicron]